MLRKMLVTAFLIASPCRGITADAQTVTLAGHPRATAIPLKDDPKYSYLKDEIERLSGSTIFECRNIGAAARLWWEQNRVFGFRDRVVVIDPATGLAGYLGGEAVAPRGASDSTYQMRLFLANRTKSEIIKTFRHESAHAAGITDERAARAWAEKCH